MEGRVRTALGGALYEKGSAAEAEKELRAAVGIFGRTGWKDDAAHAHRVLAMLAEKLGRSGEGIRLLRFAISEQGGRGRLELAKLQRTLGVMLLNAGRPEQALQELLEAAGRHRALGDLGGMVACRNAAAAAYNLLGQRVEAERLLNDLSLSMLSLPANFRANQLANAAGVAIELGMKNEALRWAREGLKTARHHESKLDLTWAALVAASAENEFGDPDRARRSYAEALELSKRGGNRLVQTIIRMDRAEGCARRGDRVGMACDLEAIEHDSSLISLIAGNVEAARYQTLQARYWMDLDAEKALLFSTGAVGVARQQRNFFHLGSALHRKGEALIRLGRTSEAVTPLQEALELLQNRNRPEESEEVEKLLASIGAPAVSRATANLSETSDFEIIAQSVSMRDLLTHAALIATSKAGVVLEGESGTGKETVAREIHRLSGRKGLFVVLQGGAISENLIEDELFGHSKGAFTGALTDRRGKFELADGGTLFIDYVSEIPAAVQAKLLRAIQFGEVVRLGSEETRKVDVRLITASQTPLRQLANEGRLRGDLYYRLSVLMLSVPPLRERREDIPLLFRAFLRQIADEFRRGTPRVVAGVEEALAGYSFPGNLRELENLSQRAFILSGGEEIRAEHLPPHVLEGVPPTHASVDPRGDVTAQSLKRAVAKAITAARISVERDYVNRLLARTGGNLSEASRLSGIAFRQLHRIVRRAGDPRRKRAARSRAGRAP